MISKNIRDPYTVKGVELLVENEQNVSGWITHMILRRTRVMSSAVDVESALGNEQNVWGCITHMISRLIRFQVSPTALEFYYEGIRTTDI
jgi:hypothetical protein